MLHVIYLVFNEGYSASSGSSLVRHDLSTEAITLGRLLVELLPEPEAFGLLALMLLHDARRAARVRPRTANWCCSTTRTDRSGTARRSRKGASLVEKALTTGPVGPYGLQAAIAAVHGEALRANETDWPQIVGLYDLLLRLEPTPVVELNRAVAVAMRDGPAEGLTIDRLDRSPRATGRLSPRAFGARRPVETPRENRRGDRGVRASAQPEHAGAGTPIPVAADCRASRGPDRGAVQTVTSSDGTRIAFWRSGKGPALLLVHGATSDHNTWRFVLPALEKRFTVYAMDRRGRGGSGDSPAYDLQREAEDVSAVVSAIDGPVSVFGHSFGGLCALEAALTIDMAGLVLYESVGMRGADIYPPGFVERLEEKLAAGDAEGVVVGLLQELVQMPPEEIELLRAQRDLWAARLENAPTIPRELRTDRSYVFDAQRSRCSWSAE